MVSIVKRRKALGLSQIELAEQAGCSVASVRLFESRARLKDSPTLAEIERVLDALEKQRART